MNVIEIFFVVMSIVVFYTVLEILVRSLVLSTRRKFQWLITKNDELPEFSKEGLEKFLVHGYDSELGWVRKPDTEHNENGKEGITRWTTNEKGARTNPNFEDKISHISCYGDSFTFARQVNDNETWEHQFSKKIDSNVQNFGVGNYGIDQALLLLKRNFSENKTKIVIIAVVPDTISRILSMWKHYSEYGNTFGFKPRFIIEKNSLVLLKNLIDDEKKFYNYTKYIDDIRKYDFFYENKFKKDLIQAPYSISILKNFRRNLNIIKSVKKLQRLKEQDNDLDKDNWDVMKYVMKENMKWRVKLFNNNNAKELLKKIIEEYVNFSKKQNFKPVFIFLPQKDDVNFIKTNFHFYQEFSKELELIKELSVIDVSKDLLKESNLDEMYSDDNDYGGHYSRTGNQKIADIVYEKMNDLKLI